jgi:hypothetical protein
MPGGPKNNDEELVIHLSAGRSYAAVEKLTGISSSTIKRRMRNPAFRRRVRQARADYLERALGHLSRASADAAITLRNLLKSDDNKIKLQAAKALLDAEAKFRESEELAAEVEDLKEQIAQMQLANKRVQACRSGEH